MRAASPSAGLRGSSRPSGEWYKDEYCFRMSSSGKLRHVALVTDVPEEANRASIASYN
jgi:hypothetical protein